MRDHRVSLPPCCAEARRCCYRPGANATLGDRASADPGTHSRGGHVRFRRDAVTADTPATTALAVLGPPTGPVIGRRLARPLPSWAWRVAGRACVGRETCIDLVAVLGLDCPTLPAIVRCGRVWRTRQATVMSRVWLVRYCGLIPAAWMIWAALSLSRSTNRAKSGCVMLIGSAPCLTSAARTAGSDRVRAMSWASV